MIAAFSSVILFFGSGLYAQIEDEDIYYQGWIDYNVRYDFANNFGGRSWTWNEFIEIDGIAYAIPSSDLAAGRVLDASPIVRQVLRNFNPKRSGDIYVIYEPHWGIIVTGDASVVHHGSPWVYDTYVPIMFAGWNISAVKVRRQVETVDIAPTLALLLGAKLPSSSVGKPLEEVFK